MKHASFDHGVAAAEPQETQLSMDENDLLLLAQRCFLSLDVVKEARGVFEHYCLLEEEQQKRRKRHGLMERAKRGESKSTTVRNSVSLSSPVAESSPSIFRGGLRKGTECNEAGKGHDTSTDGAETAVVVETAPHLATKQTSCQASEQQQHEEEAKEPTLGVEGLQQFFHDLGLGMSSLEVSDMVRTFNDDPIDFVLRQRNIEAAAAAAAAASSLSGSGPSKKSKSPSRALTPRRKENSNNGSAGSNKVTTPTGVLDSPGKGEVTPQRSRKSPSRNGVTFPIFLFILSHMLLEHEDSAEAKDNEVREVFHIVDVDGDGCISVGDVQATVQRLVSEGALSDDRDIQQLSAMNLTELNTAMLECDIDGDGHITMEDLLCVLRS